MFGLFSSPTITDPDLGELKRSRGMWRGRISSFAQPGVPLIISGSKSTPDCAAMTLAKSISSQNSAWKIVLEKALFEHLTPYAEAVASGEIPAPEHSLPEIKTPSDVWPHVSIAFVAITPLDGKLTLELGCRVTWDEDHTLGARFQDGQFLELCGSVLCP